MKTVKKYSISNFYNFLNTNNIPRTIKKKWYEIFWPFNYNYRIKTYTKKLIHLWLHYILLQNLIEGMNNYLKNYLLYNFNHKIYASIPEIPENDFIDFSDLDKADSQILKISDFLRSKKYKDMIIEESRTIKSIERTDFLYKAIRELPLNSSIVTITHPLASNLLSEKNFSRFTELKNGRINEI